MAPPTVHHNPGDTDGLVWMLAGPGGSVWRLSDEEARELSAQLMLRLAEARNDSLPIDAGHPDLPWLTEPMEAW